MGSVSLLQTLLARGDSVAIESGMFMLISASGNPVPYAWLQQNQHQLISDMASVTGVIILTYEGYSTGRYCQHKTGGVNIQFDCLTTGTPAYAIFNADLTRARTTKHGTAGSPLPKGHFTVTKRRKFYKFWLRSSAPIPKRLSTFHEHMGSLKGILFTGVFSKGEKLEKDSVVPLNLTCEQLRDLAFNNADSSPTSLRQLSDIAPTKPRQLPDKTPTRIPDKQSPETNIAKGFQRVSTTGDSNYGNKEQGNTVTRVIAPPIDISSKRHQEQSIEDWVKDYDSCENQN